MWQALLGTVEAASENVCGHLNGNFTVIILIKHPEQLAKELFRERSGTFNAVGFTQTKLLLILVGVRNLAIDAFKYLML